MKIKCTNCLGSGLIGGNKEKPWIHEGAMATCPVCTGTGMIDDSVQVAEQEPVKAPEAQDTSKSDEQANIEADMDIDEDVI